MCIVILRIELKTLHGVRSGIQTHASIRRPVQWVRMELKTPEIFQLHIFYETITEIVQQV